MTATETAEMTSVRVTQASLNQTSLDWTQNMENAYKAIDIAIEEGSDLLVLPELSLTGYEVNDDFQRTDNDRIYEALNDLATYAHGKDPNLMVTIGHPWRLQFKKEFEAAAKDNPDPDLVNSPLYDRLNKPFNVQTMLSGGKIQAMTAKKDLYNDGRGYEGRYHNAWSFRDAEQAATILGVPYKYGSFPIKLPDGEEVQFGRPIVYVTNDKGHGYFHAWAICEEKWVEPDNPHYDALNVIPSISRYLGTRDALLLEIANASPPEPLKQDRHMQLNNLASEFSGVVIDTDGLGTSGSAFAQFGHRLISKDGETISAGRRMEFGQLATTTSTIQVATADPDLAPRAHSVLEREFQAPDAEQDTGFDWQDEADQWDHPDNPHRWKEERIRNQALWMWDYIRKTKCKGIAEALSGGKDSSFNCAMVRVMVELAMHDLGIDEFCEQMSHLPYIDEVRSTYDSQGQDAAIKACMDHMLTGVYMGTNNSSEETYNAAKALIEGGKFEQGGQYEGIGGKFMERNIQDLVTQCAVIFGLEDSSKISKERKIEIIEDLEKFIHASPHEHTPEDMEAWMLRLQNAYPEIKAFTSAAMKGQGIAYENFQARIREVLIMAIANVEGKMAVANPNLDEGRGAYATFGGDLHSGTINANGGIHKADQEDLMDYLEEFGVPGVMKRMTALSLANGNPPSAELQPKNKEGKVVQFDEDALEGSYAQKKVVADLMHGEKVETDHGMRWRTAGEVYDELAERDDFDNFDANQLFSSIAYTYHKWEGPARPKLHAGPIAPTFGHSVDPHMSLRKPNLNGGSKDEIIELGLELMFIWAEDDGLIEGWDDQQFELMKKRAWQDTSFKELFYHLMWNPDKSKNVTYDLRRLYEQVANEGWDNVFPMNDHHPVKYLSELRFAA